MSILTGLDIRMTAAATTAATAAATTTTTTEKAENSTAAATEKQLNTLRRETLKDREAAIISFIFLPLFLHPSRSLLMR